MIIAAALLLVCAQPSQSTVKSARSPPTSTDATSAAPKLRSIELDGKKARAVYKVNAAPGLATVIELPEPWATPPTCGDCVFGDNKPDGQLWRIDLSPSTRTISLKPTRLPGADMPPAAFVTNIDVTLDGGIAITLFVELTLPEAADARVEFTIPNDEKGAAKLSVRERELEVKLAERVAAAATDQVLSAAMHGTTCKQFEGRPNRHENVVVRLRQICRTSAIAYVTFEVENRRHDDIGLVDAALGSTRHAAHSQAKLEKKALHLDERGLGIVALPLSGDNEPDRYRLKITVHGVDDDTDINVDDVDF